MSSAFTVNPSKEVYMMRAGGGVIIQSSADQLVAFRNAKGQLVAWIDSDGVYHRTSTEPPPPKPPPDVAAAYEAAHVRAVIAALPLPPRGFRTEDALALSACGAIVLWFVVTAGGWYGWRRIAARLLVHPLRRLGKWLDRGPRTHEAEVLRFKRDLNRTVEQLESERSR